MKEPNYELTPSNSQGPEAKTFTVDLDQQYFIPGWSKDKVVSSLYEIYHERIISNPDLVTMFEYDDFRTICEKFTIDQKRSLLLSLQTCEKRTKPQIARSIGLLSHMILEEEFSKRLDDVTKVLDKIKTSSFDDSQG